MDMDGKVGTIVSSLKDEEGALYSISSHEETTEENYSVTNQDLEDSQSEDSSQGDLDDYYDKQCSVVQERTQPTPIEIKIDIINPPSDVINEIQFNTLDYKTNIERQFKIRTLYQMQEKKKEHLKKAFDRLYINRRVEIFNFQELGTRGKVENTWDFSRMFESVENMDIEDEMFSKETQRRFIFAPSGYGKSCFCEFAIYQWSKGVVWNEYELVVLIKANRINRMDSNQLLITLLEQSIIFNNVQQRNLTLKYLESLASQNKLLILVDGVDEIVNFPDEISEEVINKVAKDLILTKDDTSLDGFQVIVALLLGQLFRGVHLILTTRNETMKCLWELCLNQQLIFQAIKVLPFEEEDVFKYIHKIHHDKDHSADLCRNETCQRTILLLKSNYNLLKLCSNPSCCMIVGVNSEILSSEKAQNLSTTNLISRFMGNVLAEHARLNSGIKALFHGLSTFYKETFKKISKIAFVMFSRGERIMKGTFKEKENACSQCASPDCEISLDSVTFECENRLNALGLLSLEKDNFKNVTCAFGQEIGLLRDYFAAAYIVCEDKRISDITKFISDNKKFGKAKEFAYLNNHLYDILPIIACMLFSTDIFTKSFLEMMDNKKLKNNLSKRHFYKDITKLTQSRIVINENDGIFQVQKSPSQVYGSKVARHLSRCAFESQEKCFDNLECSEYRLELLPEFGVSQPMLYFSWIQNLQYFTLAKISTLEMLENFAKCLHFVEQLDVPTADHGLVLKVSLISILASPEESQTDMEVRTLKAILKSQRLDVVKLDLSYRNDIWSHTEDQNHQEKIHSFLLCALSSVEVLDLTGCSITIFSHEQPYDISGKSRLKELILRNSIFYNFRESIPASPLFSNILRIDITNASIFLSRTSFERMSIMDHILKQKKDNKKCKIKDIVTDRAPTYKYKHLGVNISRGAVTNLSKYPETYLPEDINIPHEPLGISCVSKLRNHFRSLVCASNSEDLTEPSACLPSTRRTINDSESLPSESDSLETSV